MIETISRSQCKNDYSDFVIIRPLRKDENSKHGEFVLELINNRRERAGFVVLDKAQISTIREDLFILLRDLAGKQLTELISGSEADAD